MDVVLWAAIITVIGGLVAAVLPAGIQKIQKWRREAEHRAVTVARIHNPEDAEVWQALRLYERRIPATERDEPDDIVRWLQEVKDETKRGVCKLDDYFLVAHAGRDLAGFAYIQFYPATSLGFFSYLVVDDRVPEARYCNVTTELLREARRLLTHSRRCHAVIIEVDEPAALRGPRGREAAARIRHFKALARMVDCPLKSVSINYLQPKLALGDSMSAELKMRLMYAPLGANREPRRLHKRDVLDILDFLALCIYGDHFEHSLEQDRAYREYLDDWKRRIMDTVRDVVELA